MTKPRPKPNRYVVGNCGKDECMFCGTNFGNNYPFTLKEARQYLKEVQRQWETAIIFELVPVKKKGKTRGK